MDQKPSQDFLQRCGFENSSPTDFKSSMVKLRDGRDATLWIHQPTGHGVLDPAFWESSSYYDEAYRKEFTSSLVEASSSRKHFETYQKLNKQQFEQFSKYLSPQTKYLEVGCAFGGVLSNVQKSGVKNIVGVEPNRADAAFTAQNNPSAHILNGYFGKVDLVEQSFDLMASFEVLEHVENPNQFLKHAFDVLALNGRLHLEVPNHHDALLYCFKNPAYTKFYYHKAHIHYFTPNSLRLFCEKNGFKGDVTSFQMYPFQNQLSWMSSGRPQSSADVALQKLPFVECKEDLQGDFKAFFERVSAEYDQLINKHLIGDCLVFSGVKQ